MTKKRKLYRQPRIDIVEMRERECVLAGQSNYVIGDLEDGGDLGGKDVIDDLGWGGDLGGNATGGAKRNNLWDEEP